MILTFEIEVDVPDRGEWVPYVKQQLLRTRGTFEIKSVIEVPTKEKSWFENYEKQEFYAGRLDI